MVKVYFETPNHSYAERVATFHTEELYIACLPILEAEAKKQNFIVTESIEECETEEKHNKLREILIDHGNKEWGDCIIDEISELFNFPTTIEEELKEEGVNEKLEKFDLESLDTFEKMQYNHFVISMSKKEALQILINTVEGDFSQLSEKLCEIAEEQENIKK